MMICDWNVESTGKFETTRSTNTTWLKVWKYFLIVQLKRYLIFHTILIKVRRVCRWTWIAKVCVEWDKYYFSRVLVISRIIFQSIPIRIISQIRQKYFAQLKDLNWWAERIAQGLFQFASYKKHFNGLSQFVGYLLSASSADLATF